MINVDKNESENFDFEEYPKCAWDLTQLETKISSIEAKMDSANVQTAAFKKVSCKRLSKLALN